MEWASPWEFYLYAFVTGWFFTFVLIFSIQVFSPAILRIDWIEKDG